ncbi:UNVERIFIED_CONTAM: Cytosolic sulfotransferase 8 [Sesamum angustifolium]|uniref:Sulfotransferase n=1 Tax=Sesamum angustifolium TaxID=2727405 RepID=A0AAW2JAR3_9LAMI
MSCSLRDEESKGHSRLDLAFCEQVKEGEGGSMAVRRCSRQILPWTHTLWALLRSRNGYRKFCLDRPKYAHFLTYEELKNDPKTHVRKLAEFLGCPFEGEDAEAQVQDIEKGCSFEVLSNHEVNKAGGFPSRIAFIPSNSFFRKGVVGDYEEHMSAEVVEKIDALTKEKFHSFGFMYGV